MPFDWLHPRIPNAVKAKYPVSCRQVTADEIRARSSLLHRLGYDQAQALHRCLGNLAWGYEMRGRPALSDDEVRGLVAEVYARRPGA
jgi:uracil-DNA glycosylase